VDNQDSSKQGITEERDEYETKGHRGGTSSPQLWAKGCLLKRRVEKVEQEKRGGSYTNDLR